MFKFAHIADVHLDHSQFHGAAREERRQDYADAWLKACRETINRSCEFMIVSGDLFDSQDASIWARSVAREGLLALKDKDIEVFAIPGNHDRPTARDGLSLVDELKDQGLIRPHLEEGPMPRRVGSQRISIHDLRWAGAASHQLIATLENPTPDQDIFHILIAHIGIGNLMPLITPEAVPLSIFQSTELSFLDYVALGHVHIPYYDGLVNMPGPPVRCNRGDELGGLQVISVEKGEVVDREVVAVTDRPYFVMDVEGSCQAESALKQYHNQIGLDAIISLKWTKETPDLRLIEEWKRHYLHIQFIDGTNVADEEESKEFSSDNIEAEVLAEALGKNAGLASQIIQAAVDNNSAQVLNLMEVE